MMILNDMEKVIAIFDVGKTNKKVLLFDSRLNLVMQEEQKFPTITDEDGFECDNIELIESWMLAILMRIAVSDEYELAGVNFSTYGASLAFIGQDGKRQTPIYNYLKPIDAKYQQQLFDRYDGQTEFCRKTASPALGVMLNSGIQALWFKNEHAKTFATTRHVLHFPQYLSYLLTKQIVSEPTSIGCHTFMWDFDKMDYHPWLADEEIDLPKPVNNDTVFPVKIANRDVLCGVGIHDSSSSLAPYFKGCDEPFVLVGTGTWFIHMNPFNASPLTADQLKRDCLCFMSITQQPVKSSRLFMGHIHDVNVDRMTKHFGVQGNHYKTVTVSEPMLRGMLSEGNEGQCFFVGGVPPQYVDERVDLTQFATFEEAYHRLMFDITLETQKAIALVHVQGDGVKNMFVSGGFARNEIFVRLLAHFFPALKIYTSEVDNSSALGAALVIYDKVFPHQKPPVDLGLKPWSAL
ncbi:sugar (pentulose or hexulose) kinase [Breznakibacter xylanolyticus]|uniref:Sugar (Pentulose or hexulose) kinase n=2 Tax=Breznakibacter xylanolyticus TaxID=990 RepID=A0A2W7NDZ9_9BACT|nr:sugar (pentulose or hexulose) kinase [Breznakibacter xylanolyticus]